MSSIENLQEIYFKTAVSSGMAEDANDITQDLIVNHLSGGKRPVDKFIIDFRKKSKLRQHQVLDSIPESTIWTDLDTIIYTHQLFSTLNKIQTDFIILKYLYGFTDKEIAKMHNISVFRVKKIIYLAVAKLKSVAK